MNRAERKKHLIAQGAIWRAEVMLAKETVHASLRPESIARSALHQLALGALAILNKRGGGLSGINLRTLLPLAITGISALSRNRGLLKTLLRGVAVAGVTAGIVALVASKQRPVEDTG